MNRNPSDWQQYIDDLEARLEEAEHRLDTLKADRKELALGIVENDPKALAQAAKVDSDINTAAQLCHNLKLAALQAEKEKERAIIAEEQEEKTRKAKQIEDYAEALTKSAAALDSAFIQLAGALEPWLTMNEALHEHGIGHDYRIDFKLAAWRAFRDGEITDHRALYQMISNNSASPGDYRRATESPTIAKLRAQAAALRG